jgi:hypothetical protein
MALIDHLETMLPGWANDLVQWTRLGGACAAVIDALIEGAQDAVLAAMPGHVDGLPQYGGFPSLDGLALNAQDRRIARGLRETPGSVAAACRNFRALHRRAGTAFGLLEQVRRVLGPNPPTVRLVSSAGVWHSHTWDGERQLHLPNAAGLALNAQGVPEVVEAFAHPWDWDGQPDLFRVWLIIYVPTATSGLVDGNEGTWNDGLAFWGDGGHIGLTTSTALIEQLRGLLADWLPEGVTCPWIIFAFDEASFDPATPGPYPAAGMPDGTWGRYGTAVGATYVRTRLATARYVRGATR